MKLGSNGAEVSRLGLGCMGMSFAYGATDDTESIATLHRALDLGITFLDTADLYGYGANEELVGRAIADRRDEVFLATKFGIVGDPRDATKRGVNGSPGVRPVVDRRFAAAARRRPRRPVLPAPRGSRRTDRGDGRGDGRTGGGRQGPVPRVVGGVGGHHPAGARRAPDHGGADRVVAVQPRHRGVGAADLPGARHRDRAVLPARSRHADRRRRRRTSPPTTSGVLCLASTARTSTRISRWSTRSAPVASRYDATPGQVALAWVLAQGNDVAPIPGTKRRKYLEENAAALELELSADDQAALAEADAGGHALPGHDLGRPEYRRARLIN